MHHYCEGFPIRKVQFGPMTEQQCLWSESSFCATPFSDLSLFSLDTVLKACSRSIFYPTNCISDSASLFCYGMVMSPLESREPVAIWHIGSLNSGLISPVFSNYFDNDIFVRFQGMQMLTSSL